MADTHESDACKTWVFVSGENTRLDELIALLGGGNEVASIDSDAYLRRTGELIAHAASTSKQAPASSTRSRRKARGATRSKR